MSPINITAVLVAALATFVVGFLLHGPIAGKLWMKLSNIHPTGKEKLSDMYGQMFWNYVANIVCAIVMSGVFWLVFSSPIMGEMNAYRGAIVAFWLGLGFVVTAASMETIWMGRSVKLWLFEAVASILGLMAMGAVLGGW